MKYYLPSSGHGLHQKMLCALFLVLPGMTLCCISAAHASEAGLALAGMVLGPDESPVPGLYVETDADSDVTDDSGAFFLNGLAAGDVIVRLRGDQGEGRVRVSLGADDTPLLLTYPVNTTVILLHDNDLHFNFNHREMFAAEVDAVREQYANVFLMSAGDIFVRHPDRWARADDVSYYIGMCAFIIDTMNAMAYDVCTPGNHELHYIDGHTRKALEMAQFPLLGANIHIETENLPSLKPYVVFETDNNLTLAVLGLTRGTGRPGVETSDPIDTARAYRRLAHEHDLFVALTHIGLGRDRELAEAVPELDVIIGGHSHNLLDEGEEVNGVLIGMAGGPPRQHQQDPDWPKYLGKIEIKFQNDRIVEKTARVMTFEAARVPAPMR